MEVDFYSTLESVREKIERGEKYYALLNDKSKWNQYCASLYAIEDAQCAIEAYTSYEFPTDIKGKYLYIYGLLQALFYNKTRQMAFQQHYWVKKLTLNKSIQVYLKSGKSEMTQLDTLHSGANQIVATNRMFRLSKCQ